MKQILSAILTGAMLAAVPLSAVQPAASLPAEGPRVIHAVHAAYRPFADISDGSMTMTIGERSLTMSEAEYENLLSQLRPLILSTPSGAVPQYENAVVITITDADGAVTEVRLGGNRTLAVNGTRYSLSDMDTYWWYEQQVIRWRIVMQDVYDAESRENATEILSMLLPYEFSYLFPDSDITQLTISDKVYAYEYTDAGFILHHFRYGVFDQDSAIAEALAGGGEKFQVNLYSWGLNKSGTGKAVYIYDSVGSYLYDGENFVQLHTYPEEKARASLFDENEVLQVSSAELAALKLCDLTVRETLPLEPIE